MPLELFENPVETEKRAQELLGLVDATAQFLASHDLKLSEQHLQHFQRVTLRGFAHPMVAEQEIPSWIQLLRFIEDLEFEFGVRDYPGTRAERLALALTLRRLRGQFSREYRELREKHGLSTTI